MKAGHRDAFAPLVDLTSLGLSVSPMITCTGIQEDGDEEEVDEATSQLSTITSLVLPLLHYVGDTRYIPDLEMLPAPMRGDHMEVIRTEITLVEDLLVYAEALRESWAPTLMTEATKSTTSSSLSFRSSKWLKFPDSATSPTTLARSRIARRESRYLTCESMLQV